MKKFLLSLLALTAISTIASAKDEVLATDSNMWPNNSSYTGTLTSKENFLGSTWKAEKFNNNNYNSGWTNLRCGYKSSAQTAAIYNVTAIANTVSKVIVATSFEKTGTNDKVTSSALYVSADNTFPSDQTTKVSYSDVSTAGNWTYEIPAEAQGKNLYYKVEFETPKSTNSGFLGINSLTFSVVSQETFAGFKDSYDVSVGKTTPLFSAESAPEITYTSSNEAVVTVNDATNELQGVSAGTATVTASWNDSDSWKAGDATFNVTVVNKIASFLVDETSYDKTVGEIFTIDFVYEGDGKVTISSSDDDVATATIEGDVITVYPISEGDVILTLSATATEEYSSATQEITVKVDDPSTYESNLTFNTLGLASNYELKSRTIDRVTYTFDKGTGSNASIYHSDGHARIYQSNTIKISVPDGYYLTSVDFIFTTDTYKNNFSGVSYTSGTYNSGVWKAAAGNSTKEVTFTHAAGASQTRLITIEVSYGKTPADGAEYFESEALTDYVLMTVDDTKAIDLGEDAPNVIFLPLEDESVVTLADNTLTAVAPGTAKVTAIWEAVDGKWAAGATTFNVYVAYPTLAAILEAPVENETYYGGFPLVIVSDNGMYNYVTDGTAWAFFYVDHDHADGSILPAGWSAEYVTDNGLPEFVAVKHEEISETMDVVLREHSDLTISKDMINEVMILDDVVFSSATPSTATSFTGKFNGKEITFYNQMKKASVPAGTYNVKAVIGYYELPGDDNEGQLEVFPIEYMVPSQVTEVATHVEKTYNIGDVIEFEGLEEGARILYRHGGEDPDHNNVFTEVVTENPANAPAKVIVRATDVNTEYTYNHDSHPLTFEGEELNVKYVAKKAGKAPSAVQLLSVNSDGETTGIESIAVDHVDGAAEYFNLQGQRVANPEAGLYIVRRGTQVSKVLVK